MEPMLPISVFSGACPEDPDRVRRPDLSFISIDRLNPDNEPEGYCDVVPDLAVEVISPNDRAYEIAEKVDEYLRAGVKLVWVVMPPNRSIEVRRIDGSCDLLTEGDELSGEDVVPGLKCAVSDIFRPLKKTKS